MESDPSALVRARLRPLLDAGQAAGLVLHPADDGLRVGFQLNARPENVALLAEAERIKAELSALPGVASVTYVATATSLSLPEPARAAAEPVPHVTRLLAVMSGKGGVGKSTVAVGLAHALRDAGLSVGVLDADIHGPSIARMFGATGRPEAEGTMLIPLEAHGILTLSTGQFLGEGDAAVMRGPMVAKTLRQFLRQARWGTAEKPLDLLILDLPPGTGDIHLSLIQSAPLGANGGGALLVTTPQQIALIDAKKAASLCRKTGVPILGIVENMSWLEAPDGARTLVFGEGAGQTLAHEAGSALLGQLPLDPALGRALDQGLPPPGDGFAIVAKALRDRWAKTA